MPILRPVQDGVAPEFLTIGHVTRDIFPDGSSSRGATASFAAITARRLGLASAVVTCADAQLLSTLPSLLPAIGLAGHASPASTTFSNQYHEGFRTLYLLARADSLLREDVPAAWRNSPVVLLGPLAQELDSAFVTLFPRRPGPLTPATPHGWLPRRANAGPVPPPPCPP